MRRFRGEVPVPPAPRSIIKFSEALTLESLGRVRASYHRGVVSPTLQIACDGVLHDLGDFGVVSDLYIPPGDVVCDRSHSAVVRNLDFTFRSVAGNPRCRGVVLYLDVTP